MSLGIQVTGKLIVYIIFNESLSCGLLSTAGSCEWSCMPDCKSIAVSEDYADFIVNFVGSEPEVLEQFGAVCYQRISSYYGTVYRPLEDIEELSLKNYEYNTIPALYGLSESDIRVRQRDLESALEQAGIYRLQNQPALRLRGQGCLVAFVDTGINIEDNAFRFSNGDTRIIRMWDMTDDSGMPPLGIAYGSEYDEDDINRLLKQAASEEHNGTTSIENSSAAGTMQFPCHDDIEHGNILAKIAAGNDGAVPECSIIVVKLKPAKKYLRDFHMIRDDIPAYQENDIMLAVNYVKDVALQLNMPVSLCIALGTNSRSHDGRSALSYILDSFTSVSSAVASVAGGEEGNKQLHVRGGSGNNRDRQNETDEGQRLESVEMRVDERQKGVAVHLWGANPQIFSVGIISPTGEVIPRIPARLGRSETYSLLFEGTTITIEYDLAERDSGDELILIRFHKPTAGIWKIQVYGEGRFDAYLPLNQFIYDQTYFLTPEPDTTIIDPAYARRPITAVTFNPSSGALYVAEGRGFARNGYVKPDIAAPLSVAVLVGAATQLLNWGIKSKNVEAVENADIKSYLIRGAIREAGQMYPSTQWGYGKLDAYNAFEVLRGN